MESIHSSSPLLKSPQEKPSVKRSPFAPLQWKSLSARSPCQKSKLYNDCTSTPLGKNPRLKRGQQFGLTYSPKDPYLHNQSFPCVTKNPENENAALEMGELHKCSLDKFKGDSLNSFNFSPCSTKSSYPCSSNCYQSRNLSGSWLFYRYVDGGSCDAGYHVSVQNPNKAIVTIDSKTTEILIANKLASHLLGIRENSPLRKRLCDFILSREDQCLLTDADLEPSGELVLFSGKVMDLVTSEKETTPVSVWARQLLSEDDRRCLVVMEPVERTTGIVDFDEKGIIVNCDNNFALLFGYQEAQDLKDFSIKDLIPSVDFDEENNEGKLLPDEGVKQCATGKLKDGTYFPLSINIKSLNSEDGVIYEDSSKAINVLRKKSGPRMLLRGSVWVFNNISGMITLLQDGTVHSCNTNFSLMLFGYTQNELIGLNITKLIPTFYDDLEHYDTDSMALPPLDDDEDDSNARWCPSDGRTTADSFATEPSRPINPMSKQVQSSLDDAIDCMQGLSLSSSKEPFISSCGKEISPNSSNEQEQKVQPECQNISIKQRDEQPKTDDLSESSSHCEHNSSRHLSFSESQGTLHSSTNSITESDVNANVLEQSESSDCLKSPKSSKARYLYLLKDGAPVKISKSSSEEESLSSLADDFESESEESDKASDNVHSSLISPIELKSAQSCPEIKSSLKSSVHDIHSQSCIPPVASTPRGPAGDRALFGVIPSLNTDEISQSIQEGCYNGTGRHKDGSHLDIEYFIKKAYLDDGSFLYCLWVSRDPVDIHRSFNFSANNFQSHSVTTTTQSSSQASQVNESCSSTESDSTYSAGIFSEKYAILQHIGKGAFGCVKKVYRISDGLLVISKFIRKSTVHKEFWVHDNQLNKMVPLEISILTTVDHPNIVKVLDIFENEKYFQMVMEKHGSGMDLFEFIERNPNMDEPLASFILRQVVSALSYLDSLLILHRDIKDENIILDQNFHVRLIDFGSATFRGEELFSTFCGTMEYCSPEVIRGNKYRGPELEMWALGVTLYTLVFGENPFIDVEETLKAELKFPFGVSKNLSNLIRNLLEPDPVKRCTLAKVESHPWTNQQVQIEQYKFSEVVNASAEEIDPPKYITDQLYFNDAQEFVDKRSTGIDSE